MQRNVNAAIESDGRFAGPVLGRRRCAQRRQIGRCTIRCVGRSRSRTYAPRGAPSFVASKRSQALSFQPQAAGGEPVGVVGGTGFEAGPEEATGALLLRAGDGFLPPGTAAALRS
jgi:hypothetical protein